ncbi:MAG: DNA (cytosine-5-)-methyltransferase [Verrucomicrobiales bacterium]
MNVAPGLSGSEPLKYIDLFCGIGGFRQGVEAVAKSNNLQLECVFSSDIDKGCQLAYEANYGERPVGDITQVDEKNIPDHNLLLAGFPCQPFSIIGQMKGFADTRGTLFFDIARILAVKKPQAFILENVKLLVGHNKGETLKRILFTLRELGYSVDYRVLNALHFGLPQKRERVFIVGFLDSRAFSRFKWCEGGIPMISLKEILEATVDKKHFASERIRSNRLSKMQPTAEVSIWHENKAGHISAYPYSCALRAGASYNYLLVNGERRLTPREMLRLQGFPDTFKISCNDSQTRKQAGNSVPVNLVRAVAEQVFFAMEWIDRKEFCGSKDKPLSSKRPKLIKDLSRHGRTKAKNSRKKRTAISD